MFEKVAILFLKLPPIKSKIYANSISYFKFSTKYLEPNSVLSFDQGPSTASSPSKNTINNGYFGLSLINFLAKCKIIAIDVAESIVYSMLSLIESICADNNIYLQLFSNLLIATIFEN